MKKGLLLLGAIFAMSPVVSYASGNGSFGKLCKGDALGLCFFDIPNKKDITQCLIKKKHKVSHKCRPYIDGLVLDDDDPQGYRRVQPVHLDNNSDAQDIDSDDSDEPEDSLEKDTPYKAETPIKKDDHVIYEKHENPPVKDGFGNFFDVS